MSAQIIASVLLRGTAQDVAFNTDFIYLQESAGSSTVHCNIFYFGDPTAPTVPTAVYQVTNTIASLVTAAGSSLVQATIWRENNQAKFRASIKFAFPVAGYSIAVVTGDVNIHSTISYRGTEFGAEETVAVLVAAADAGGGGGGGSVGTLQQVTDLGNTTDNGIEMSNVPFHFNDDVGNQVVELGSAPSGQMTLWSPDHALNLYLSADIIACLNDNTDNQLFISSGQINWILGLAHINCLLLHDNITAARNWQLPDASGTIIVVGSPTFTGTLAAAISAGKSVVNGVIIN